MITINVDLGAAVEIDSMVLYDHNLSATATIILIGADPPLFSEAVVWNDKKIIHYLSVPTTKRYWQLQITDAGNPDGYIEIGELYLGTYLELTKNYIEGYSKGIKLLYDQNTTKFGIVRNRFYNQQRHLAYSFGAIESADIASLEALLDAIAIRSTGELKPVFYNDDSAYPSAQTWLAYIYAMNEDHKMRDYFDVPLEMIEAVAST